MKLIKISAASAFLLALGIAGPVVARQEKPDKQQEEKAKPQKQEEKGKAQKQEQPAKPAGDVNSAADVEGGLRS